MAVYACMHAGETMHCCIYRLQVTNEETVELRTFQVEHSYTLRLLYIFSHGQFSRNLLAYSGTVAYITRNPDGKMCMRTGRQVHSTRSI